MPAEYSAALDAHTSRERVEFRHQAYRAYLDEELSEQATRLRLWKARTFRTWASSDWVWYWGSTKHSRQTAHTQGGRFLGPARVLLQEREQTEEEVRHHSVVWAVHGGRRLRMAPGTASPI